MPEKLHDCVRDVKGQGKSEDSAWAICNDSIREEVATAIGIAGLGIKEDHHPLDHNGIEVPDPPLDETVSIPSSASAVSIGAKKKDDIKETIYKQILETQLGECPCKNKSRPKA